MRILVVHNQLWAHYKSKLFEEIHQRLTEAHPEAVFQVVQIALYESSRSSMQPSEETLYHYPHEVLFKTSLEQVGFFQRLFALLRSFHRFRPSVVNLTGYYDWAQVLLLCYARLRGVKVVLSSESSAHDQQRSRVKELVKRWIVKQAQAYFCFGKTSVDYLIHLGVKPEKIAVRHAAVIDDARIKEAFFRAKRQVTESSRNFIFVGRFSQEKNLHLLLDAYFRACNQHTAPWGLLLVGDGPVKTEIEKRLTQIPRHRVVLAGGTSWLQVPEWLAQAEVLILPSYSEPWGLVVNEALVCGLPVIVSEKCGCVPDLVEPGKNGYVFDPYQVEELTHHLLRCMNSSASERASYGRHGYSLVSKFAAEKVAGEMVDTFVLLNASS